jgi:hypothetical protein
MAKTATKKASGKKKATKKGGSKKGGRRNAIVTSARALLRDACPHVMNGTLPLTTDGSGRQATKLAEFREAWDTHMDALRKHIAGGGTAKDAPVFPASKFFDPNSGRQTQKQFTTVINAAMDEDASGVEVFPKYNPVQVEVAHALNCLTMRRGQVKNHKSEPKGWDKKTFGEWNDEWDEDGEIVQEPSGKFVDDELPRMSHKMTAEELVTDPDNNVLSFGSLRVVCGDGTHDGAACFLIRAHRSGNYGAGDASRKRLSLAGKPVKDVVFRIEDRPNNGGAYVLKGKWVNGARVITEIPFMPGQVLTAGNLTDQKGNVLDAKAIRKLGSDTKGLKFAKLANPIIGKVAIFDAIWGQVSQDKKAVKVLKDRGGRSQEWEAGSPEAKTITNLRTTSRISPYAGFAFGFKSVQADMVPYMVADGKGKIEDGCFGMGVVIGDRSAESYNVGVHAAKDDEPVAKPKKATPKAAAPKKTAAKKTAAKKKSDAAPKVESTVPAKATETADAMA